ACLAEEHATEWEPAERPRHAQRFGQGARSNEGQGTSTDGRREGGGRGKEERFHQDQHDRAVPVEGAGPEQADGITAQAGEPSGPHTGPQPEPGKAPVQDPGTGQPEGPPPPRGQGEREQHPRHDRRDSDAAPAPRPGHETARAAARPLAMQAGMPTPRYADPATARPPRRATAASTP